MDLVISDLIMTFRYGAICLWICCFCVLFNLSAQVVRGRKSFVLMSPHYMDCAYPVGHIQDTHPHHGIRSHDTSPEVMRNRHFSQLHLHRLQDPAYQARYPLAADGVVVRVDLAPGDLLYFPRLWWHQVTSFDEHVSVNYWF